MHQGRHFLQQIRPRINLCRYCLVWCMSTYCGIGTPYEGHTNIKLLMMHHLTVLQCITCNVVHESIVTNAESFFFIK